MRNKKVINKSGELILHKQKKRIPLSKVFIHLVLSLFGILCVIPLWAMIAISATNEQDLVKYGYALIPKQIDLSAYKFVLAAPQMLIRSYEVTFFVVIVGTVSSLFLMSCVAYVLSRPDYRYKSPLSFYIFFTMIFSGGLVPLYILINNYLHLKDNIFVLIVPYLIIPMYVLLLRTFFQKTPFEIIESCCMDGASEFTIFFKIILPISKPALATIGLFVMLIYWNDWWLSLLFIEKQSLIPLQLFLYSVISNINFLKSMEGAMAGFIDVSKIPQESARMVLALLAAGPMLFVFPLFQKYFVKGLTLGSLKG